MPSALAYLLPFTPYPYRGERVACPVCGGAGTPIARMDRRLKRLPTDLCGTCGLFFTNPMPTEAELEAYYRDTYRRDYQLAFAGPGADHRRRKTDEAARRYESLARFRDLSQPVDFLDFGCGSGELVRHFAEAGHRARGFEPGADYARHAAGAGSVEILNTTWEKAGYVPESFDLVACLHVLEHLRRPVAALARIAEWLRPGGLLLAEVPDMQAYALKGFEHFHFAHVLGFSSENLALAGERAGFGVVARLRPTSILFAKGAPPAALDLAGTVARNRAEYGKGIGAGEYLAWQVRRMWRRATGGSRARPG